MSSLIQREFFFKKLVEINDLKLFKEWFFYNGMLFNRSEKWWGRVGNRPSHHEGIDIGFYKDTNNTIQPLKNPFRIPVVADGIVVEISDDDLLGNSIFIRHEIFDKDKKVLHSVYAHSTPVDELEVNDRVEKGFIIGSVTDISSRDLMISAHLHMSMIWLTENYPNELLKWQILPDSKDAVLADPFDFLDCRYSNNNYQP